VKGQAEAIDIIGILALTGVLATFLTIAIPSFLKQFLTEYVRASGEFIAREISGVITLMRAAESGKIYYQLPKIASYDIDVSKRVIKVSPEYEMFKGFAEKTVGISYSGVEIPDVKFEDVKEKLVIEKDKLVKLRK
jgi:hypothetical protein